MEKQTKAKAKRRECKRCDSFGEYGEHRSGCPNWQYKPEFTLLCEGNAGPFARIGDNCSVSGMMGDITSQLGNVIEGGFVIDQRTVEHDAFIEWVCCGPSIKESLPKASMEKFNFGPMSERKSVSCSLADILWEGKGGKRKVGGFDYISLDLYLELWHSLGAKVGQRKGNAIHWYLHSWYGKVGEIQTIPKPAERFNHLPMLKAYHSA